MAFPSQSSLTAAVRNLIAETATDFYTDANLIEWLNDGQRYCAENLNEFAMPQLLMEEIQTTTASVEMYPLPAALLKIREVELQSIPCRMVNVEDLFALVANKFWDVSTDAPAYYISGGMTLGFRPVPPTGRLVRIRFISYATTTEQTTNPKLPDGAAKAVVFYTAARAKEKEAAFQEASIFQAMCDKVLGSLNAAVEVKQ